jgi:hypothetical protein
MRSQLFIGVGFVLAGIGVLCVAQIGRVTLEGSAGGVTCSYRRSVLGLVTTGAAEVRGVRSATVEVVDHSGYQGTSQYDVQQVVLETPNGEVRPPWLKWRKSTHKDGSVYLFTADFPDLDHAINAIARQGKGRTVRHSWSLTLMLVGGGVAAFGVLSLCPWPLSSRGRPAKGPGARG